MEQENTEAGQENFARACDFLLVHSPTVDSYEQYQIDRIAEMRADRRTWVVGNVKTGGRVYDLYEGLTGPVAQLEFDGHDGGTRTYSIHVEDHELTDELSLRLDEVRREFDMRGHSPERIELQVLGEALRLAEKHADSLKN